MGAFHAVKVLCGTATRRDYESCPKDDVWKSSYVLGTPKHLL